jgi:hypothetical protein
LAARAFSFLRPQSDPEAAFVEVSARRLLAVRRTMLPGRSLAAQASLAYTTLITLGLLAILFWGFWNKVGSYLMDVAGPYAVIWGAPAILLVIIGALRYNTFQGFVSFTEADCTHILTAAVRRRGLTWPRLRTSTIVLGLGGAVVGLLAGVASGRALGENALSGFALGVLVVGLGWQVQRSARISRWVVRLTLPALGAVVLLVLAERFEGLPATVAAWSGPWGWATLPSAYEGSWQGFAGIGLLWLAALLSLAGTALTAGRCSLEGFRRRAKTRSNMVAGLYALDARSAVRAARQPTRQLARLRLRPRVPRRPELTLAWRGLLGLMRAPLRLGWGVLLAGGAALLFVIGKGSVGTAWGGALLVYLAASSLLEPLRTETDSPGASHLLLPWSYGRVLWLHCLLPAVVVFSTGFVAAIGAFAAGQTEAKTLLLFVITWLAVAPVSVAGAAISSRRGGRVSGNLLLMTSGDSTGLSMMLVVMWVFGAAIASIAVIAVCFGLILQRDSVVAAVVGLITFSVLLAGLRGLIIASRPGAAGENLGRTFQKAGEPGPRAR